MPFLWCQMPFHVNSILDLQYLHFLKGKTKCQPEFINNGFTNSSFKKIKQFECCKLKLISFVFSKKFPNSCNGLSQSWGNIEGSVSHTISKALTSTSKQSRDIPVWQMIRMDMKISRIVLTEKVNYLECEKGLRIRIIS